MNKGLQRCSLHAVAEKAAPFNMVNLRMQDGFGRRRGRKEVHLMLYGDIACPWEKDVQISCRKSADEALCMLAAGDEAGFLVVAEEDGSRRRIVTQKDVLKAVAGGNSKTPIGNMELASAKVVKAEADLDLRDFKESRVCIIRSREGRPCGYLSREKAQEAFLHFTLEKLDKMAKKMHLLGGESYKNNKVFFMDVSPDTGQIGWLLDAVGENNQAFWKLLRYSSDSIYVADQDGVSIFVNKAFLKDGRKGKDVDIVGRPVEELSQKGYFYPAVTPMVIREKKSVTLKQNTSFGSEWWIVTGTPIFDDNGKLDMVITNSKNLAECKELLDYTENGRKKMPARGAAEDEKAILYTTPYMQEVVKLANAAAEVDSTVLITGESGVGKSMIAKYIHKSSNRADKEMIEINCSSIPESLFESELFGYEVGAFTGARAGGKPGLIELADKGTLLLDEVGDIPLHLQGKLLYVLQEKKVIRVGGTKPIDVDVRIIAATNQPLEKHIEEGRFRPDLYYRLNVFPIHMQPLRNRTDEIPIFARYYLQYYNEHYGKHVHFSDQAIQKIKEVPWPGNVRQLESFMERLVILYDDQVGTSRLMPQLSESQLGRKEEEHSQIVSVYHLTSLQFALEETEKQLVAMAAEEGKSSYEVARLLGISQTNAYRKMKKYL